MIKYEEQKEKKLMKSEQNLGDLQDTSSRSAYTSWVSEKKKRIFKEMVAQNFPSFMKNMTVNSQEAQQTQRPTPRHIINKSSKAKTEPGKQQ